MPQEKDGEGLSLERIREIADAVEDQSKEGITAREMAKAMGIRPMYISRRLRDLVDDELVEYLGKAKRPNVTGRMDPTPVYRVSKEAVERLLQTRR